MAEKKLSRKTEILIGVVGFVVAINTFILSARIPFLVSVIFLAITFVVVRAGRWLIKRDKT